MSETHVVIDTAIKETDSLRTQLKRKTTQQVRAVGEKALIKATSQTWFKNHRPHLLLVFQPTDLEPIDKLYGQVLTSSDKDGSRQEFITKLKTIRNHLVKVRSLNITKIISGPVPYQTSDKPPDFAPLIADLAMQEILKRRWKECTICIDAGAPLSATVMMGGLLEALLLARIHRETDKTAIFKTKAVPIDRTTGKAKQLNEWMLHSYIDVTHELGWISESAKDVGVVLRDYRNFIHPYKELSHGIKLTKRDALILWEVCKSISRQVIDSVP
jgi:hypothetical protein